MSISTSLRKAAEIQEQIESLRAQLADLLTQAHAEIGSIAAAPASGAAEAPKRRGRKPAAETASA